MSRVSVEETKVPQVLMDFLALSLEVQQARQLQAVQELLGDMPQVYMEIVESQITLWNS